MSEPTTTTLPTDGTGTLLGIWAHPDDEAYLSAGLMASAVRAGQRVAVVTATAGELGTPDPERCPPGKLATVRRREMTASLAALGVTEHTWLGYPDGGCAVDPRRHRDRRDRGRHRRRRPGHDRHVRPRRHDRAPRPPGGVALGHRGVDRHPPRAPACGTPR